MAVIIPPDASVGVQTAFQNLDTRLQAIERAARNSDAVSQSDLAQVKSDLTAKINALKTVRPLMHDTVNVMRGAGAAHALGHVPDPGSVAPTTGFHRVLSEDGIWRNAMTPGCVVTHSVGQAGGAGPVDFVLNFDTDIYNPIGVGGVVARHSTNTNNNRITFDVAGVWACFVHGRITGNNVGSYRGFYLKMGSGATKILGLSTVAEPGTISPDIGIFTMHVFAVNDWIEAHCQYDSTASLSVLSASEYTPIFGAFLVCTNTGGFAGTNPGGPYI
jgi:hypothetical protein